MKFFNSTGGCRSSEGARWLRPASILVTSFAFHYFGVRAAWIRVWSRSRVARPDYGHHFVISAARLRVSVVSHLLFYYRHVSVLV